MMQGGELYVPRIPSMRILDLVEAVAPDAPTHEIGIRPGEKLHEEMIAADDSRRTLRFADRYVVQPTIATWGYAAAGRAASRSPDGFTYRSDNNDLWLDRRRAARHARRSALTVMLPYGRQSIDDDDVAAVADGAAQRLADHRPAGRRVRGRPGRLDRRRAVRRGQQRHGGAARRRTRPPASAPATRWSPRR